MPKGTPGRLPCSVETCREPAHAKLLCQEHYDRWRRRGDPTAPRPPRQSPLDCIEYTDGCWFWTGTLDRQGYGQWMDPDTRRTQRAHRVVYKLLVGPIPDGLPLDHECHNKDQGCAGGPTCRQRSCVRPHAEHVLPRTLRDNILRGRGPSAVHARKTHCPRGHPYDKANTYVSPSGQRFCKACKERWRPRRQGAG
jgi:hypothetical protein